MENNLLHIPQMVLIGSSGRNSGKTTLGTALVEKFKDEFPVIGLKVTTIKEKDGKCPRGGEGCGVCSSLEGNFDIVEEKNKDGKKDTQALLASGADNVYWIRTLRSHIDEGIQTFMNMIPEDTLIICESNSLRKVVRPGSFIMMDNSPGNTMKESAQEVVDQADIIIDYDIRSDIDTIIEQFRVNKLQTGLEVKNINK